MLKSKIIDILKTFSKAELKSFRDFVASPYHNSNKNVIKTLDQLRKYHPDYSSPNIKKEKLFAKLFPGKKFNDTVIRILLSDLLKLSEEFLSINSDYSESPVDYIRLLQELRDRNLDAVYKKNYKEALDSVKNYPSSRDKFFKMFELEVINVEYHLRKDKQLHISGNILNRAENLIYFMIIELIHNAQDIIINEKTYNVKYDHNILMDFIGNVDLFTFIKNLKPYRPKQYEILKLHYSLLEALTDESNEEKYDEFRKVYLINQEILSTDENNHFLNYLETCCLMRSKYNTAKYRLEVFFVYEHMLKTGAYSFHTNTMTAQRFKNILISAVNLKKIEWAEDFIIKYSPLVQKEYTESMYHYGLALVKFLKKDFTASLLELNKVKNDYIILKMDIKSWALKNYYELGYYEQALAFIDSYRHFLNKNRLITEYLKERHLNFVKFTSELIKRSAGETKDGQLKNNIKVVQNVVHKDWLLEKLS